MKNKTKKSATWIGAVSFFILVAVIMQIAILTYDFIIQKTDNTAMIAVLILVLIFISSSVASIGCFVIIRTLALCPQTQIGKSGGQMQPVESSLNFCFTILSSSE